MTTAAPFQFRRRVAAPSSAVRRLMSPGSRVGAAGVSYVGVPVSSAPITTDSGSLLDQGNDLLTSLLGGAGVPADNLPTLATTASFTQGRRYMAGLDVPSILPTDVVQNSLAQLPGFSSPVVYPIADSPYQIPSTVPPGATYIVTATRSGATVQDQPLPAGVLWVVDAYPDVTNPPVVDPPSKGGTPPIAGSAAGTIFGVSPWVAAGVAGAAILGIVLLTSSHETKHHRVQNPRRRRRIRR